MAEPNPKKPEDVAPAIIEDLDAGRADAAHARLGATIGAMPPQTLLARWKQAADGLGARGPIERTASSQQKGLAAFTHVVKFEKGSVEVTSSVNLKTLKAEGFWVKRLTAR